MANIAFGHSRPSFSDRTTSSMQAKMLELGDNHQRRLLRYQKFWEFYEGRHWDSAEFEYKNVVLNYARRIVDVKANFLNKGSFTVNIPDLSEKGGKDDTLLRQFIKIKLDEQWRLNKKKSWFIKLTQVGGVTGDAFIRIAWDTSGEVPFAKADVLPSNYCFPVYNDISGDLDHLRILIPYTDKVMKKSILGRKFQEREVERVYEEVWTKETVVYLIDNEVQDTKENIIGEIPFVHIRNYPNSNGHFGISDLADLTSVQRLLNEKATDISDIIDYHGSPVTIAYGVRADQMVKGPDKVWTLPSKNDGADIQNLQLIGDLKANLNFLDLVRKSMLDLSGVPDQAINPTTNVSNTPGVALHMTYLPLIEVRAVKEVAYGEGIQKVNRLFLKMLSALDAKFAVEFNKLPPENRYITSVKFGEPLPRDESLLLENGRTELDMGITTRKRLLMEQRGMGAADADRLILEADEEKRKIAELTTIEAESQSATQKGEAFGKGRRPDPVVQGDRVSKNAGKVI